MSSLYAGVCLLDNPYHIDGIYDYEIPVEMGDTVREGSFVTVPFGVRNQPRLGLVAEIRETSDYKAVKMIKSRCPESIALDGEMLGLCKFLKERTLCATGDAVRAMVPASALSRLDEFYLPLECEDPVSLPELEEKILVSLKEKRAMTMSRLREQFGILAEKGVRRLLFLGLVEKQIRLREANEGKTERFYTLAVSPDCASELADGKTCEGVSLRSENHRAILRALLEENAPMSSANLCAAAGVTSAQIKTVLDKGLLHMEERTTSRNPYTEAPYVGQTPLVLNEGQQKALATLSSLADAKDAKAALLHGITGSGKTRVMTALIDHLISQNKGVILLLPEIALTPQSVSIFCARYGNRVAVIHSALSVGERYDAYCRIKRGEADIVIGTRSAVFAPVQNLGAIIIDEEQEHTYKSDQNPKYHAKDVARYRCHHHGALMLLASATPSLESYKKAMDGAYTIVELTERCGNARLPSVSVIDMREESKSGNSSAVGTRLAEELSACLARGEQAILFLNRRGYNRTVSCRSCGKPISCPRCSVAMTYHTRAHSHRDGELVCHWCGTRKKVPSTCPECGSEHLGYIGYGTQRVEEELATLFPSARILRMDADTTATKASYDLMLSKFRRHEADILLGTQMVTKGHDFPGVTLVGVLLADSSLYVDDYRAGERTFAMLTQVIGRAGRADLPGHAVIQTSNPDSEIIRLACAQDFPSFYNQEIRLRRLLCFPPACDVALLTVSGSLEADVLQGARRLHQELESLRATPSFSGVELIPFGPFEAPVYRVDNRYRMRMVIKCRLNKPTLNLFHTLLCVYGSGVGKKLSLSIDLNPSNL